MHIHSTHKYVNVIGPTCTPTLCSATGTRTRVARVRAEYPSQLDYGGVDWPPKNSVGPVVGVVVVCAKNPCFRDMHLVAGTRACFDHLHNYVRSVGGHTMRPCLLANHSQLALRMNGMHQLPPHSCPQIPSRSDSGLHHGIRDYEITVHT